VIRRLAAAALAVALLAGCSFSPHPAGQVGTSPAPAISEAEDRHEDGPGTAVSAPAEPAAVSCAEEFVRAWAQPGLPQPAWYTGVKNLVVPGYAQLLSATDPSNVPAHTVTGAPAVISSTAAVVIADVPTDAGAVRVTVVAVGGQWLVATAEPASAAVEPR
jgi:hypothetical protein